MQHAVALEWLIGWSDASSRFTPSKRSLLSLTAVDSADDAADAMAVDTEDSFAAGGGVAASGSSANESAGRAESDCADGDTVMRPVPSDERAGSVASNASVNADKTNPAGTAGKVAAGASDGLPHRTSNAVESPESGNGDAMPQLTAYELLLKMLTEPQLPIIVEVRPRAVLSRCALPAGCRLRAAHDFAGCTCLPAPGGARACLRPAVRVLACGRRCA
jgi:hypothetical protein